MTAFSKEGVFDRQPGWEDGQIGLAMARKSVTDETEVLRESAVRIEIPEDKGRRSLKAWRLLETAEGKKDIALMAGCRSAPTYKTISKQLPP